MSVKRKLLRSLVPVSSIESYVRILCVLSLLIHYLLLYIYCVSMHYLLCTMFILNNIPLKLCTSYTFRAPLVFKISFAIIYIFSGISLKIYHHFHIHVDKKIVIIMESRNIKFVWYDIRQWLTLSADYRKDYWKLENHVKYEIVWKQCIKNLSLYIPLAKNLWCTAKYISIYLE